MRAEGVQLVAGERDGRELQPKGGTFSAASHAGMQAVQDDTCRLVGIGRRWF